MSEPEAGPPRYLERMTYPQVERLAARTDLVLLPVGSPEAHGPHLPVGTDLIAARELCERAAQELAARGVECLIAPLLPYCLAEVVAALVADVCRGLARSGFRRTLLVSVTPRRRTSQRCGQEPSRPELWCGYSGGTGRPSRSCCTCWRRTTRSTTSTPGNGRFPELGAPEAYCGDPRRATPTTAESLYAALGEFIAEEGASLLRS